MTVDDLDGENRSELRRLGELLFDVAGREPTRAAIVWQARIVAYGLHGLCARRFDRFSEVDFDALADLLLEIADDWLPVEVLMASALAIILGDPLPEPPSWADARQRANLSDGGAMQ